MSAKRDGEIHKMDTVPPPDGGDDAYNAPTKVGALAPDAWAQLMRDSEQGGEAPAAGSGAAGASVKPNKPPPPRPAAPKAPPSAPAFGKSPSSASNRAVTPGSASSPDVASDVVPRVSSAEDDEADAEETNSPTQVLNEPHADVAAPPAPVSPLVSVPAPKGASAGVSSSRNARGVSGAAASSSTTSSSANALPAIRTPKAPPNPLAMGGAVFVAALVVFSLLAWLLMR